MYHNIGVIKSGGIELRGMKASLAPRRQQAQATPKLEKYQFVPYDNTSLLTEDSEKMKTEALTVLLQTVMENSGEALKLKVAEVGTDKPIEAVLAPMVKDIIEQEPMRSAEITVVTNAPVDTTSLNTNDIKHAIRDVTKNAIAQDVHLVIASDVLSQNQNEVLNNMIASVKPGGFILLEEVKAQLAITNLNGLEIISKQITDIKTYLLLRKAVEIPNNAITVKITENNFSWVESVKDAMKKSESDGQSIYLYVQGESLNGIIGMVNCLKQEPGGINIRSFFIQDKDAANFSLKAYEKQLKKDLVHNVLKNGLWGCYRHIPLEYYNDNGKLQVEHAYINTQVRGDLSSLRWIESPLRYDK